MNQQRPLVGLSLSMVLLNACAAAPPSPTATAPPPTAPPGPPTPISVPTQPPTPTSAPTRTPVPTSLPKDAAALLGVYVATFSKEYTAKMLADMGERASELCEFAGEYRLTLTAGCFQLRQAELPGCVVRYTPPPLGDWTVTGDQIEFRFEPSYVSGWPCSSTAVYTWKLDGNAIRFAVKDDICFGRIVMFRNLPWIRQDK